MIAFGIVWPFRPCRGARIFRIATVLALSSALLASPVQAGAKAAKKDDAAGPSAKREDVTISAAWTRAADAGENTHVFLRIENKGAAAIRLKGGAAAPAASAQLVQFKIRGALLYPTLVDAPAIGPSESFELEPGVVALELRNLRNSLTKGTTFPVVLDFGSLGEFEVAVRVQAPSAFRFEGPTSTASAVDGKGGGKTDNH